MNWASRPMSSPARRVSWCSTAAGSPLGRRGRWCVSTAPEPQRAVGRSRGWLIHRSPSGFWIVKPACCYMRTSTPEFALTREADGRQRRPETDPFLPVKGNPAGRRGKPSAASPGPPLCQLVKGRNVDVELCGVNRHRPRGCTRIIANVVSRSSEAGSVSTDKRTRPQLVDARDQWELRW